MEKLYLKTRKIIALVLILCVMLQMVQPAIIIRAEEVTNLSKTIEKDNYSVTFSISELWEGHHNVMVTLKNTTDDVIDNWALKYEISGEVTNVWNAGICSNDGNNIVFKNAGWNQDVEAGSEITFGYTLKSETPAIPSDVEMVAKKVEVEADRYEEAHYVVSNNNGTIGGEINVTNISHSEITDWILEFDYANEITEIANGTIIGHTGNHYVVKNLAYSQNIAAEANVVVTFVAKAGNAEAVVENIHLYEISTEEAEPGGNETEEITTEEVSSEEVTTEEVTIEEVTSEEVTTEETTTETATEEVTTEETSSEEATESTEAIKGVKIALTGMTVNEDLGVIYVDELLDTIEGEIYSADTAANAKITITNAKSRVVLEKEIEAAENFKAAEIGFYLGKNTITVEVTYEDGDIMQDTIELINSCEDNMSNLNLDESDADGDGLLAYQEDWYGTNPEMSDTDGDGLSDYTELLYGCSDPLKYDTDENGISDGEEDSDSDGLTNIQELLYGTEMDISDSDGDSLNDNEELSVYSTNPLERDTDGDGAADGWEVENSTDPLTVEETFDITVTFEQESGNSVNVNSGVNGEQIESFTIEKAMDDELTDGIPGLIENAVDVNVKDEVTGAVISFEFDETLLADENVVPTIYEYNEELQILEEMATTIEGNTASAEIDGDSKYVLLDKKEYDKIWEQDIISPETIVEGYDRIDVAFVIDSSNSMRDNDPDHMRQEAAKLFIDEMEEDDRAAIIEFEYTETIIQTLTSDKEQLSEAVDSIVDGGSTSISAGMRGGINQLTGESYTADDAYKYIILLTDGASSFSTTYITKAKNAGIVVYTVGLGKSVNKELLIKIAEETGGKYYYADSADVLLDIYEDIANRTIDFAKDSNGDGISDYYTKLMCKGLLRNGTGLELFENKSYEEVQSNADFDGDGLLNGEEVKVIERAVAGFGYVKYALVKTSPVMPDTDMDGHTDKDDANPRAWDVGHRDLAIFSALAYEDGTDFVGSMYTANDIVGKKDFQGETIHFASGASIAEGEPDVGISSKWQIVNYINRFEDIANYFSATTFKNGDNIVIAYRGTDDAIEWVYDIAGVGLFNWHIEEFAAKAYAYMIADRYPECKIYITGHSLGGYLAQIGAADLMAKEHIKFGEKVTPEAVVYFNGLALKASLVIFTEYKERCMEVLEEYNKEHELIAYRVEGDVVSSIGEHPGDIQSFNPAYDVCERHAGEYGKDLESVVIGFFCMFVLENVSIDELMRYYIEYRSQSVMEYFQVTHQLASFYYNISQGTRSANGVSR